MVKEKKCLTRNFTGIFSNHSWQRFTVKYMGFFFWGGGLQCGFMISSAFHFLWSDILVPACLFFLCLGWSLCVVMAISPGKLPVGKNNFLVTAHIAAIVFPVTLCICWVCLLHPLRNTRDTRNVRQWKVCVSFHFSALVKSVISSEWGEMNCSNF